MDRLPLQHWIRDALGGRYHIRHEIGHGAMATVFLAEAPETADRVAVKVLRPELGAAVGPERFHREIEILTRLRHPRIVPVLDSDEAGGLLFLVMPYVAGENLRSRLEREGQLPTSVVFAIAGDIAAAIDYAHGQNVIHRDIKPENILLAGERALVCDFGLARAIDRAAVEPVSSSGLVLGTPAYMSPEQAMGHEDLGPACDIYALGCVVYEMLTGDLPFTGSTPQALIARQLTEPPRPMRSVRPDLPGPIEAAVLAALAKDPSQRPRSGADFLSRLTGESR
jgi:eukaryotic-like serine/threonine-protein kinase